MCIKELQTKENHCNRGGNGRHQNIGHKFDNNIRVFLIISHNFTPKKRTFPTALLQAVGEG